MNIICWWKGHKCNGEACGYDGDCYRWHCHRCGLEPDYLDIVMPSVKEKVGDFLKYYFFRKWIPEKCEYCGHRYKHDETKDHIPF